MKIWVDDIRPAPEGYVWIKSVSDARKIIEIAAEPIEVIHMDHDAGDYAYKGGDYIHLLDWLEFTGRNYPIAIHSQNPVGVENIRRIIRKNGWEEIK